jgi:hypothetical protein
MPADATRVASAEDEARFVLSFVEHSGNARSHYEEIWQETLQNYLVRPLGQRNVNQLVQYPHLGLNDHGARNNGYSQLKDPESHQLVESLLANEMVLLYSDLSGALRSRPVGMEDAHKSTTVNRLLTCEFRREGHYRSLYEWSKDKYIFGTGILESYWYYKEEPQVFRSTSYEAGVQLSEEQYLMAPVYDGVKMRPVDLMDFFPDPGHSRICDMEGVAKRFQVTAQAARENPNYDQEAVKRAILHKAESDSKERQDKGDREGLDRPMVTKSHPDFKPLVGYCYYGNVPYKPKDGVRRRRVEVLCGEVVLSQPWYGRVPFFENSACPIQGRFYGLSPLEVMRFSQDYTDTLKNSIADAVLRMVYMAPLVDRNADVQGNMLKRWHPDKPIYTNRMEGVQFLPYAPPLAPVFATYQGEKEQIQQGSGALGVLQGQGLGVNRASGTEAAGTFQRAGIRPEASAMLTEREYLPPLGLYNLKLCQRYIQDDADLAQRVGEMPEPAALADIMGDFDLEFIGSRLEGTKAEKLAAFREAFGLGANPIATAMMPWGPMIVRFLRESGLHEEALEVGKSLELQLQLGLPVGQPPTIGNGNGEQPNAPPAGMLPAQSAGM